MGYCNDTVMYRSTFANICLYVVKPNAETLLSGKVWEELGIITFNSNPAAQRIHSIKLDNYKANLVNHYPNVFHGIGKLNKFRAQFHIDKSIPPIVSPARSIPFHLQDIFKNEIAKMEATGIIEKHNAPARWISNPVSTPKDDGRICITIDMGEANKAVLSTNIPIHRAEDIRATLSSCKFLNKLGFKSTFHQIGIAEESQYITVFYARD